jgi:hypothetical protein
MHTFLPVSGEKCITFLREEPSRRAPKWFDASRATLDWLCAAEDFSAQLRPRQSLGIDIDSRESELRSPRSGPTSHGDAGVGLEARAAVRPGATLT